MLTPNLRKFALTTHIIASVGWLGAAAAFLILAVAALTKQDAQTIRAADLALALIGWYAIIPLCIASLLTGVIMSLGTKWGLFRHYWVLIKLLLTLFSSVILFEFTHTLTLLGNIATDATLSLSELQNIQQSPILHASGGLLLLIVNTVLSVYKPKRLTFYGWRKQQERTASRILDAST